MLKIILNIITAYILTCVAFGIVHSIYFIHFNKQKIFMTDDMIKRQAHKPAFVFIMYVFGAILMTWEYLISPWKFYKTMLNN